MTQICISVSILLALIFFAMIDDATLFFQQIRLEQGGDLYNRWVDIKIPIYMKVYFFNITNPEEFSQGAKPILNQVGPWIYQ